MLPVHNIGNREMDYDQRQLDSTFDQIHGYTDRPSQNSLRESPSLSQVRRSINEVAVGAGLGKNSQSGGGGGDGGDVTVQNPVQNQVVGQQKSVVTQRSDKLPHVAQLVPQQASSQQQQQQSSSPQSQQQQQQQQQPHQPQHQPPGQVQGQRQSQGPGSGQIQGSQNQVQSQIQSSVQSQSQSQTSGQSHHTQQQQQQLKIRLTKSGTAPRYGAKKRSWVWLWFVQDINDPAVATCQQCHKVIRRLPSDKGSPKKLSEHLKTHKIFKRSATMGGNTLEFHNSTLADHGEPGDRRILGAGIVADDVVMQQHQQHQQQQQQHMPPRGSQHTQVSEAARQQRSRLNVIATSHGDVYMDTSEFDHSEYSQMKFHKDIMKFLTDNKLPIHIVKTPSFRQLIYTLKPEAILDLNELNNLYSSLIQVIKNDSESAHHAITGAASSMSSQLAKNGEELDGDWI